MKVQGESSGNISIWEQEGNGVRRNKGEVNVIKSPCMHGEISHF